jgi:hypothetical protein
MKSHLVCIISIACLLTSCFGPAYPERDGKAFLESRGCGNKIISDLISGETLSLEVLSELASVRSIDVKFLVGRHKSTRNPVLETLLTHESDFVRGGAALNPNLSEQQIKRVIKDPSHTTRLYLARNPSVPEKYLFELRKEPNMDLVWFAMNPNCPEALKKEMRDSNDSDALYWLEVIERNTEQDHRANRLNGGGS